MANIPLKMPQITTLRDRKRDPIIPIHRRGDSGPTVPKRMGAPAVLAVSTSQVDVTRGAPGGDGGSPITQYDSRWRADGSDWFEMLDTAANFSLTNLSASSHIEVENRAVNALGNGAWSLTGSDTTFAAPLAPDKMAPPTVTPTGATTATIDRAPPPADNGSPVQSYKMRYRQLGIWTEIADAGASEMIGGLTPDTQVEAQNLAISNAGAGPWSDGGFGTTDPAPVDNPPVINSIAWDQGLLEMDLDITDIDSSNVTLKIASSDPADSPVWNGTDWTGTRYETFTITDVIDGSNEDWLTLNPATLDGDVKITVYADDGTNVSNGVTTIVQKNPPSGITDPATLGNLVDSTEALTEWRLTITPADANSRIVVFQTGQTQGTGDVALPTVTLGSVGHGAGTGTPPDSVHRQYSNNMRTKTYAFVWDTHPGGDLDVVLTHAAAPRSLAMEAVEVPGTGSAGAAGATVFTGGTTTSSNLALTGVNVGSWCFFCFGPRANASGNVIAGTDVNLPKRSTGSDQFRDTHMSTGWLLADAASESASLDWGSSEHSDCLGLEIIP